MRIRKPMALAVAILVLGALLAACGSSSNNSTSGSTESSTEASTNGSESGGEVAIDLGSTQVNVPEGTKPRIAVIPAGLSIEFTKLWTEAVEKEAEANGLTTKVYDPNFDPTRQAELVQTVIQSGEYDALAIEPLSPQLCGVLTKDAPESGLVVVVNELPICGRETEPFGEGIWAPGTLAYVGAQISTTYLDAAIKDSVDSLGSGPQVVAGVLGEELNPSVKIQAAFINEYVKSLPNVEFVGNSFGEFSTPAGIQMTERVLQAHPDVTAILSPSTPEITVGVVKALENSGKAGKVKVFDISGASSIVPLIKSGDVSATYAYYPKGDGTDSVKAILNAFAGKAPERAIPGLELGTPEEPYKVTKESVDEFEPGL